MKTLTYRAIIAAAILAAATSLAQSVAHGQQKHDSDGKYADVNGLRNSPSSPAVIISCFSAALIKCWRF